MLVLIQVIVLAPISVCFSITATYLSLCSFKYLCIPSCCPACMSPLHCMREWRRCTIQSSFLQHRNHVEFLNYWKSHSSQTSKIVVRFTCNAYACQTEAVMLKSWMLCVRRKSTLLQSRKRYSLSCQTPYFSFAFFLLIYRAAFEKTLK